MSAADVVVLVAAVVAAVAAVVAVVAAVVLVGQVGRLERAIEQLRGEAVPLVHEARQAVDHASSEIARVGAVLEDTESVTAMVDSASRLAQRVFANPLVKVLALRAGTVGGLRRLRQPDGPVSSPPAVGARSANRSATGSRANGSANGSRGNGPRAGRPGAGERR